MIPHSKPYITNKDRDAVDNVLRSGMIAHGDLVRRFEEACARFLNVPDSIAVNRGTTALTTALLALEMKSSAEVILPTYVCKNVAEAILFAGYKPVFCDVGDNWNMTPETVTRVMSDRTGAIVLVHIFGIPAHVESFLKFGIPIIEDACQAFGTKDNNQFVGTKGNIGFYSFHATKCLTTGEGGLIVSKEASLIQKMRELRDGQDLLSPRLAVPLTDLQAALGLSQLESYNEYIRQRRRIADRYFTELNTLPIRLPDAVKLSSLFFRFPIRCGGNFNLIQQMFAERGIHVRQGVDNLLHRTENILDDTFPKASLLSEETVSLPIYPALTNDEQTAIISACREIWGH